MSHVLAFDIGGTTSRAKWTTAEHGAIVPGARTEGMERAVGDLASLRGFLRDALASSGPAGPDSVTVAAAGPATDTQVRMTNWADSPAITLDLLESVGLPVGRTRVLNDVVAGAYGMIARLQRDETAALELLSGPESSSVLRRGHLVYTAPGTGLGAATVVREGPSVAVAVGCEAQHTVAPRFDPELGPVFDRLAERLGHEPTWEDIVSGRGLAASYGAIEAQPPSEGDLPASAVAAAAEREDTRAQAALSFYYRTLARFCQSLALTFQPCAAVFVGGSTTERNRDVIARGDLAGEFCATDEALVGEYLQRTPLFAVFGDPNLDGGLWVAARTAR